jgi:methylaspartate mutase sigma subunit
MEVPLKGARVVIGSIGDDIHVVGIAILGHALRNAGAEVIQLGIQTMPDEFIATAVTEDVDAILVSSSNGHSAMWCGGLRQKLDEAGAAHVILYVGGNLAVSASTPWPEVEQQFLGMGFSRVFGPRTQPADAVASLAADIAVRDAGSTDAKVAP